MKSGNQISLCMIVRNEAEFLGRCLDNIMPIVDELIIVDTGSTDETPDIATLYGAKLLAREWNNDFSEARNFSISQATSPWVLVLDADEILSARDHSKLKSLVETPDVTAYSLIARNYVNGSGQLTWNQVWQANLQDCQEGVGYSGYLDHPAVRLFPRKDGITFSGRVHETVERSLAECGISIKACDVILHHYGQARSSQRMTDKKALYLELGRRKLQELPHDARAHFEMGIQLQALERYEEAIPHFQVATQLSTEFSFADLQAGICFSRLGKFAEAERHLLKAQETKADSAPLFCELGILSLKRGRFGLAIHQFEEALALNPEHVASLCYLGSTLASQGPVSEGVRLLEKALKLDREHHDSWANLALIWERCGELPKALACLRRANHLKPDDPDLNGRLGLLLGRMARASEATDFLERAVHQKPEDTRLSLYWAASLAASGEKQKACEILQEIYQRGGPLSRLALQHLNRICLANESAKERIDDTTGNQWN